jgi:hypothetical protein
VVNKSNLQSETVPRVTSTLDNIYYFKLYPRGLKQATGRPKQMWETVKNILRRENEKPQNKAQALENSLQYLHIMI